MPPSTDPSTQLNGMEAVFLVHRAALVRFARARGATDDAEDIVQELWARVQTSKIGPVADPIAYLYRMADNMLIDRMRADIRRRRREDEWRASYEANRTEAVGQASAERSVIARQQLDAVEHRLAALGERTLAILRSYRVDGLGQREIAREQGISLSAVEKHLQRAYRVLLTIQREERAGFESEQRLDAEGAADERG